MIITNTQPRLLVLPPLKGSKFARQIMPGTTELPDKVWGQLAGLPTVKRWVEEGYLRIKTGKVEAPPSPADLQGFSEGELLSALEDPETPTTWHAVMAAELEARKAKKEPVASKKSK